MPFESGTFALTICRLSKKMPEDHLARFAAANAGMLDQVKDEPVIGWVSGRHLLEYKIDEETGICGGHIHLAMRKAERKVPGSLLKAICKREELVYMQANKTAGVPSKVRKEIKAEAIEKNLLKMPPSISGVPFVIDMAEEIAYVGTTSAAQLDELIALFLKTHDVELLPLSFDDMMFRFFQTDSGSLPMLTFAGPSGDCEATPGRDFLTWLWYQSEVNGAKLNVGNFGDFEVMIEGPLTLAFAAEAKGAGETTVKKGCPMKSAEVKSALSVGKKLKKAKLTLTRGEDIWAGSFDADKFCFSGLALPEGEEMESNSRFAERITNLYILQTALQEYFKTFAESIMSDEGKAVEKKIKKWIEDRDSY